MESRTEGGTATTSIYTYDDNGNLLTELDATNTAVVTHSYDGLNRLISSAVGSATITYTYNPQGIRTSRTVGTTTTEYLLDGGNVVGETTGDTTTTYLRGLNLISDGTNYYLYNAHGDVAMLANASGTVIKSYSYDAFGNMLNTVTDDTNPFRYCGEYYDTETGNYYLRARYYDPGVGRFTQQDTHWNTGNMIYGDTMQKLNVTVNAEGMENFTTIPQMLAIRQAGNLYGYAVNNPVKHTDSSGEDVDEACYDDNPKDDLMPKPEGVPAVTGQGPYTGGGSNERNIPQAAWDVLRYVQSHNGTPPTGYKGGGIFANDGRNGSQRLPVEDGPYREYDIYPNVKGQPRGTERIVISASGIARYTPDHYISYIIMR